MTTRRILFDLLAASTGGQLTRTRAFLKRFRQYDPDSEFCILQERNALGAMVERSDLQVHNIDPPPGPRFLFRFGWQNLVLPGIVKRGQFDTYLSFSHFLPWTLPDNVTSVIGVANLAPFSDEAMKSEAGLYGRLRLHLLNRTILSSASRADHVIALSQTCRDVLEARGIAPGKISVISNGVEMPGPMHDGEAAAELRSRFGIPREFILYVSHFYPYKNFERLIEAFARLPQALRDRFPLVLVGEPHDRHYFNTVLSAIQSNNIAVRVIVVPGLDTASLGVLYRCASLFAYPSLVENSPNILLEAMAHGTPVIAGSHQPMPEFGGDAIAYFDALSVASIANSMATALSDDDWRERARKMGPARAGRYTWDRFTRDVVSLYRTGHLPVHAASSGPSA